MSDFDYTPEAPPTKTCLQGSNCRSPQGPTLPATPEYFSRDKQRPDGLYPVCKECKKEYQRRYRNEHHAELAEKKKAYAQEHREHIQEYKRHYYNQNKEQISAKNRANYRLHRHEYIATERKRYARKRAEILAYCHKRYLANKELYRIYSNRRRAREVNAPGSHTKEELNALIKASKGKCYYCGKKIRSVMHIDHVIPLSRGGSNDIGNLVVTCKSCNLRKHTKLPHEFSDKLL